MTATAPDVDVLAYFGGEYAGVALRRGWTHGVAALALWPFILTALLLAWDRGVRLRRRPDAPPARAGPLLALAALAVCTHPTLDWLNNYGLRWLMPFSGRWFYGDALFIIDPWLWLVLGGAVFLAHSRRAASLAAWLAFWTSASAVVLLTEQAIPPAARALWVSGLAALAIARAFRPSDAAVERTTRVALVAMSLYVATLWSAGAAARAEVRAGLAARGIDVEKAMVAPTPANPFHGDVVAATADAYYFGRWHWLTRPRLTLTEEPLAKAPTDEVVEAAARTREVRDFLTWSRFPHVEVEIGAGGDRIVTFEDVRYRTRGRWEGPKVRLDGDLRVLAVE
jgi:inner membrane protein